MVEAEEVGVVEASRYEGVELPEGGGLRFGGFGDEAEERGADVVERVSQFGVDEVVCELYVEVGFGVMLAFGVELGEYVFEVFEVVAEFECRVVGEELREECGVDVGDWRRVDGVGVEGYGEGGAGDVYGDVAVECQVPGAGCQRLYVECSI